MKKGTIIKLLLLAVTTILGIWVFDFLAYGATQEYSKIAAQQVNDDTSYYLISNKPILIFLLLKYVTLFLGCYIGYRLWILTQAE